MINWIDCQDKMPPQNKELLWCRGTKDNEHWSFFSIRTGTYRFGNVKDINIYDLASHIKLGKISWAKFNEPVIK